MKNSFIAIGLSLIGIGLIAIGRATKSTGPQLMGVGIIFIAVSTIL